MAKIKGESELTFMEAASIIVGHGVGAGILSVPYLAAHNSFRETVLILLIGYAVALVLHFLIAELSLNNDGAQFVKCFDAELFSGKIKKIFTWTAFILLGVSVIVNVSAFLTGAAAVFRNWFGLPDIVGMLIFYILGAGVVFVGMKLVGICEKIAVFSMVGVVGILLVGNAAARRCSPPLGLAGLQQRARSVRHGVVLAVGRYEHAAGRQGIKGRRKAHPRRDSDRTGHKPFAYIHYNTHDPARRRRRHLRGRRAGRSFAPLGRLGRHSRLYIHASGACNVVLGKHA